MDYNKPTEEFLRSIDIHELLPQQEPFVMVGTLTGFNDTDTVSETVIKEDNIFVNACTEPGLSGGVFSASGLVENIAQTCAARIGYVNKYILKKGIQLGFIGAVKNLDIVKCPKAGDMITTSISVVDEIFGMTLANASVVCNGETIVTTQIKIAIKEG